MRRKCSKCGTEAETEFCPSCGTLMSQEVARVTESSKGDVFEATIWPGPNKTSGLRVGNPNRERYFNPAVRTIVLHLDGIRCVSRLTDSFWNKCPEIRLAEDESGRNFLADWILKHGLRPKGIAVQLRGEPDRVYFRVLDPENEFSVSIKELP